MSSTEHELRYRVDPNAIAAHAGEASRLMKALSSPHRLQVLCSLADGELSVGQLQERVSLSQSALSQHLALLRQDGLVATRRESQTIYYRLQGDRAARVIALLHELYCDDETG